MNAPGDEAELLAAFPGVDGDVVAALLSSTGGSVTLSVRTALQLPSGLALAGGAHLWACDGGSLTMN
jgi:hypothetical protein